jgi:hypothetical protein
MSFTFGYRLQSVCIHVWTAACAAEADRPATQLGCWLPQMKLCSLKRMPWLCVYWYSLSSALQLKVPWVPSTDPHLPSFSGVN